MSSPATNRITWVVTLTVLAHLVVSLLHGQAHTRLGVGLANWQQVYVIVVILLAPLVALVLSWTRYARTGAWLLLVSMLGSLIFGALYHYVIISNDHVSHLPPGDARGLFRVTAMLLLITETVGVLVGAKAVVKMNLKLKTLSLFVTLLLFSTATAQTPTGRKDGDLKFEPFTIPFEGQNVAAELGRLVVRENRNNPNTNLIEFAFVRLKSTAEKPEVRRTFQKSTHRVIENAGHESMLVDARVQQVIVDYLRGGDVSRTKIALPPLKFNAIPNSKN